MADGGGDGGGDCPFIIHNEVSGMWRVTVLDVTDLTVRDVKIAVAAKHRVPAAQLVLVADGGAIPDDAALSEFVQASSWVVVINRPPEAVAAEAAAAAEEEAAATVGGAGADDSGELSVSFFFRGHVKPLQVRMAATVREVLRDVVAPAFEGAGDPDRLGLFLECALLPRDSRVADAAELLRSAPLVPVVNDLVTTRARGQPIPPDAFRTDCDTCQTAGVQSKVRPFCSLCKRGFVTQVVPDMQKIRERQTDFSWRSLESLTGKCLNPQCTGHNTFVGVYFHCVCTGTKDDGSACNAQLASYEGGRVEVLLEALFRNQYFVRARPQDGDGAAGGGGGDGGCGGDADADEEEQ